MEEEEEDLYIGEYEEGHWEWNDKEGMLVFIRDIKPMQVAPSLTATVLGAIDFKEDIDLMEQQRFRKRFGRKSVEVEVVTLQDVKDVVLFTAPKAMVTSAIINVLHLPATARFLRSLILYCQYFTQISDEMSKRTLESQVKMRTERSDLIELEYQENLEDLRILVAKEYSYIVQGEGEFAKYHHMGTKKKIKSLMKKEMLLFESLLRFCIQIVWMALGRTSFNQIEFEIHRLFKSDKYNIIEHRGVKKWNEDLTDEEWRVLFGNCLEFTGGKLKRGSPLMNEVRCERQIDYQLPGLGVTKYPRLNQRLRYLENVLIAPEEKFKGLGVSLGILGMERKRFDIMLKEIKISPSTVSSSGSIRQSISRMMSSKSTKSNVTPFTKLLIDIVIPEKDYNEENTLPASFPDELYSKTKGSDSQRIKWLNFTKRSAIKSHKISSRMKTKFK